MNSNVKTTKIFVGVDVSKDTLDIYRPDINEAWEIENSDEAIAVFCLHLHKKKRQLGCKNRPD